MHKIGWIGTFYVFIKCVANIIVRLEGLESLTPGFKSRLYQSQTTQSQGSGLTAQFSQLYNKGSYKTKVNVPTPPLHH